MRTITLEEHFVTHDYLKATRALDRLGSSGTDTLRDQLLDVGAGRIAAMDEGDVDLQVLSLAALGLGSLKASDEVAVLRSVHDEIAAAVKARPNRFKAFATPPMKDPSSAVQEIERCVRELGFVGVMLDGTVEGKFLDAPEFFPVLEAVAALGVPLYLHPAPPPQQIADLYFSGLPGELGHLLSIAGWGWHAETGLHILRLIVSGLLERLPSLRIIVGHMGEGVPYALARCSAVLSMAAGLGRSVAEIFEQQFYVTTSGYFTPPPFVCARTVLGLDRLMYSVDYPFSPITRGAQFLRSLELPPAEEAALRGEHAAAVLGL